MNTTDKELTYTVTEKEYREGLAKGWTDDDMLKPGKYKVRRSRFVVKQKEENLTENELDSQLDKMKRLPHGSSKAKPNATKLENCKVKISLYIDGDILEYFRQRAEPPHAAPYQTQINNELRRIMENGSTDAANLEKDILNNVEFLRALKEKLETV
ncbi:MAG: BrnA antitoxin family protein [Acidobacteriota bacterium]|nr:BrnA antitoxin family protein [Acidobacteriota bacterium]